MSMVLFARQRAGRLLARIAAVALGAGLVLNVFVAASHAHSGASSSVAMAASRDNIVAVATAEIGKSEANGGCLKYGSCRTLEWCAMFTNWVWRTAGVSPAPSTLVARAVGAWGVSNGLFKARPSGTRGGDPQPGDIVVYGTPAGATGGHVAIVAQVLADGRLVTIDGNSTGEAVVRNTIDPLTARAGGSNLLISGYVNPPNLTTTPPAPRDRSVSDLTGDGFADVLAYRANGELLQYDNNMLINEGGRPYTGGRLIGEGWSAFKHVLAADVTGDGFAEAIAVNPEGTMYQYDNNILVNPDAKPYTAQREIGRGWQGFKKLMAADVSGDGSADILGISAENELWYYPNNRGSNPGGVPFTGGVKIGEGWDRFDKVLLGDVTGDRYADVLGVEPDGRMFLFPNYIGVSPARPFGENKVIGEGWQGFQTLIAADVSGDGSADVLGVDGEGQMRYYPNNSGSNPGGLPFTGGQVIGTGWQGLTIASSSS
ncbi:DNA-directed RNA polymerase subunit N (RpoN/RPB10) [Thermocatellispora tengchongensis]|uniref:DNA-directed RNA polymerase subunit N (RpoN/RPB10) n=1 Tax=Thermocatellispora tengchongensis TaxID=1073253 RepID=A0A840P9H8_9ACTN|nr:tachylectin-related carbohydrate-binding protein [Thermocatellispora tengchongensis]MBB5135659.1 DNA-directed RNA polymerase subunit N (RpoN/RPB10) [Thermocatellispora tengchongensis]